MTRPGVGRRAVLVAPIGTAVGAREIAAALACAGSDPDRAGLLIELAEEGPAPRPALVASAAARSVEERLRAHLPEAAVAARGRICHLRVAADESGVEAIAAAVPLGRESVAVVSLPPSRLRAALERCAEAVGGVLLRADLDRDRALAALAVHGLAPSGLRVSVAKRPLAWAQGRLALFGALPPAAAGGLPPRLRERCLP